MSDDGTTPEAEDFFLFGMNGNTYVIDERGVETLLNGNGTVSVKPFFTPSTYQDSDGTVRQEADVRSDVIIGADGDGNISAVYTDTVPDTVNNALYISRYDAKVKTWGAPVMLAMNHMQVPMRILQEADWIMRRSGTIISMKSTRAAWTGLSLRHQRSLSDRKSPRQ